MLDEISPANPLHPTEHDPRRTLCERKGLRQQIKAGEFYIGDHYYGQDYDFLEELHAHGCGFLMRLRQSSAIVQTQHSRELSQAWRPGRHVP